MVEGNEGRAKGGPAWEALGDADGLHECAGRRGKRLQSTVLRAENKIARAHSNSKNLVALAVGTSDPRHPPHQRGGPLLG